MLSSRNAIPISISSPNSPANNLSNSSNVAEMKAAYCKYILVFKEPATTSRETMRVKETFFVKVWDEHRPEIFGIGECPLFRGLSCDDRPDYEAVLHNICQQVDDFSSDLHHKLKDWPSIVFGLETALLDLKNGGRRIIFPGDWPSGKKSLTINGLVWMGSEQQMLRRVEAKLRDGFRCIKFKIGGISFADELNMIRSVRDAFPASDLEIRLDANGAFSPADAIDKLERLARYDIHSIEQPIRQHQWQTMAELCKCSPIPIALDEELIGLNTRSEKIRMLEFVRPQYIILKPALCGGISGANEWIDIAGSGGVGWWATSALESNIGLNAIAQWCASLNVSMPQGLGTGMLYENNISSPIRLHSQNLLYESGAGWSIPQLSWM